MSQIQKLKLKAFFGDKAIKKKYLNRVIAHRKADQIIHGKYWENGKGCGIGCILHSSQHSLFESELGLPVWLAHLIDYLFEAMGNGKAKEFPEQVLKSIRVGANLDLTYHKFCLFLLQEICKKTHDKLLKPSIDKIIELHTRILRFKKTDVVSEEEWSAARSAAWSAAPFAARYAARYAARSAAWSAARYAARYAAPFAAWYAARYAAPFAAVERMTDKLLELLKEAH